MYLRINDTIFNSYKGVYDNIESLSELETPQRIESFLTSNGITGSYRSHIIDILSEGSDFALYEEEIKDYLYDEALPNEEGNYINSLVSALEDVYNNNYWTEVSDTTLTNILQMHLNFDQESNTNANTDSIIQALENGKVVQIVFNIYRKKLDKKICPKCGCYIMSDIGSLSRFDNSTEICGDCGTREALSDYCGVIDL